MSKLRIKNQESQLVFLSRNPWVVVPARVHTMFPAAWHHWQDWAAAEAEEGGGAEPLLQLGETVPGSSLPGPQSCREHKSPWFCSGSWAGESSHGEFYWSITFCWKSARGGNCNRENARDWIIQRISPKVSTSWSSGAAKEKRQRSADFNRFEVSNLQEDFREEKVLDGSFAKSAQLSNPQGMRKSVWKDVKLKIYLIVVVRWLRDPIQIPRRDDYPSSSMSTTFSNQVWFTDYPVFDHFVRSVERENVTEDLPHKKPLPRRRKNNQCIQCDRYFLTQVKPLKKHQN